MREIKKTRFLLAAAFLAASLALPALAEDVPEQAERVAVGAAAPPLSLVGSDGETTYTLGDLEALSGLGGES